MFNNYLKLAIRNLLKQKIYFGINVAGLGIAMAACFLLLLFVLHEFSYDNFHPGAERTYRVLTFDGEKQELKASTPDPLAPAIQELSPQVENAVTIFKKDLSFYLSPKEQSDPAIFVFANQQLFDIFQIPVTVGKIDFDGESLNQVLISEQLAKRYFKDSNPVNQSIFLRNEDEYKPLLVTGIFKDLPSNTHLDMDVIAPLDLARTMFAEQQMMGFKWEMFNNWDMHNFTTYVRLKDGADPASVADQLIALSNQHYENPEQTQFSLQPLKKVYLHSLHIHSNNLWKIGNLKQNMLLLGISLLILSIAILNFILLSTARSSTRLEEIGLRKTLGAQRGDLYQQVITESMLTTLVSLPLAILIIQLALPYFNRLVQKTLIIDYLSNWPFILAIAALTFFVGAFSGFYIAGYYSRFQPRQILSSSPLRHSRSTLRKVLITSQFAIFTALLTCTLFIYQQLFYMQHKDLGFNKDLLINVSLPDKSSVKNFQALKDKLVSSPYIDNVAGASYTPPTETFIWAVIATPENPDNKVGIELIFVDQDYFQTMGVNPIQGDLFSDVKNSGIIINKSGVSQLELEGPVIGEKLMGNWEIVGIVPDYHIRSLHREIKPAMFMLAPDNIQNAIIRLHPGTVPEAVRTVESAWSEINPDIPLSFQFVDDALDKQYRNEMRFGNMIQAFTLIAIIVAILGLFGLSTFMAEQKTKEIGVRKVLGASLSGLLMLMSKEYIKWILIANVIAWPVAWFAMHKWLEQFAYRIDLHWWVLALSGILALVIALLTLCWQVIKAATSNPVKALRYE